MKKMKRIVKNLIVVIVILTVAGPAAADLIYSQVNEEADQTWRDSWGFETITVEGTYVRPSTFTLEKSFSGWGDLSGYTDLTATLTFTWHDDVNNISYNSIDDFWWLRTDQTVDPDDPPGSWGNDGAYDDIAIVSLDGTEAFSDVEVGAAGSTAPTVHEFVLADLSLLDDDVLTYFIKAGTANLGSTYDFIVDSVALEITGTPVPIPAAVWLLGSGLLGFVGIRRRRR